MKIACIRAFSIDELLRHEMHSRIKLVLFIVTATVSPTVNSTTKYWKNFKEQIFEGLLRGLLFIIRDIL